ncbi:TPA: hypothetical protein DCP13_00525 [Candidatus Azambacteria bacterium]|uniref:Uncharacterized protein n=1 Tax=Candidatus Azambacteria bacterium GW2011_GWE2_46_45 TaxID=1618625 RepID=A0A0G1Q418_9BACT|nr:MAG: hypothetical protein UX55_C0030G0001 [Candidatus Azambacteria bacterium GW2011_GWE2_46_45]HAM96086.1 hypothetical protein [Candidatus Azambacteria bacterium]HAQ05278.1 hypothetical protein [Candidatus Azambacteria bacterium]HBA52547.1 hypothetical protein [Candidatus Azambacteria bacterium]
MKNVIIIHVSLIFVGFLLNLAWEAGQNLLYAWDPKISVFIPYIFFVSLKDTLVILAIYWLTALVRQKADWIFEMEAKDLIFAGFIGLAYALGAEFQAIQSGRWQYNELMPLIPGLEIGVTPILQMMILPIVTFYWALKKFWPAQLT